MASRFLSKCDDVNRQSLSSKRATARRISRILSFCAAFLAAAKSVPAVADETLAKQVPADVGLFVEVRDAGDLMLPLLDPQIWSTLADWAGQPAHADDVVAWREQINRTVRMTPEQAIESLFSRHVAFVGESPSRTQDAFVVCRPKDAVKDLLQRWNARPLIDPEFQRPRTYQLHGAMGVAEKDGLLYFGALLPAEGLFRRLIATLPQPATPRLADDHLFKRLRARISGDPEGLLFVRLGRQSDAASGPIMPVSQPSTSRTAWRSTAGTIPKRNRIPELPGPLRNAETVMLALERSEDALHFTAVGDKSSGATATLPEVSTTAIAQLPRQTLIAWQGRVEFSRLVDEMLELPERNMLRWALSQPNQGKTARTIAKAVKPWACVACGPVRPAGRPADAPAVPAWAALIPVEDADAIRQELGIVADTLALYYNVRSMALGLPPLQPPAVVDIPSGKATLLDFSPLIDKIDGGAVHELHLAWTIQDGLLIVASHIDWLRQILLACGDANSRWDGVLALPKPGWPKFSDNLLALQSGPIADLGTAWLKYFEKRYPNAMDEKWWRLNQPGGRSNQIGIDARLIPDQPNRLRVATVLPNLPAEGRLQAGDNVIGADGRLFATTQPHQELKKAIEQRGHGRYIDLMVERGGQRHVERIPMPFVNLMQALRRVIAIGNFAQRIVYFDDVPQADGARGFLTMELRKGAAPLFELGPVPASAPAAALAPVSQPASAPR